MHPHRTHPLAVPRRPGLAVIAALALALGACDPERSLAPDEPQAGAPSADVAPSSLLATPQRIVYVSYHNAQYDIYRMDATGQNVKPLTSNSLSEGDPSWSRDNKRIALVRPRTIAPNKVRRDIYIINADGTNGHWARSLTCDCDLLQPSWSPDGSRLVLTMSLNGTYYVAYLILGTGKLGAYSTGYGGLPGIWPSYTKSGQIVYLGPTAKVVFRMNGDGSNIKALYTSATSITQPALSPDGSKLAFVRLVDDFFNTDIYVRTLATGATAKIAGSPAPDAFPTWSPDGSRIAFSSARSGVTQIYTMSPNGGNVTQITHTNTAEGAPSWSH